MRDYYRIGRPQAPSAWVENGSEPSTHNGVKVESGSGEEEALIRVFEETTKVLNDKLNALFNYRKCDFQRLLRRYTLEKGDM